MDVIRSKIFTLFSDTKILTWKDFLKFMKIKIEVVDVILVLFIFFKEHRYWFEKIFFTERELEFRIDGHNFLILLLEKDNQGDIIGYEKDSLPIYSLVQNK